QPLVRLKRMGQQTLQADERVRFRECTASCHERQQTPPRSEDHASPAPGVSHREATHAPAPTTRLPTTYILRLPTTYILIGTPRGSRPTYRHYPDRSRPRPSYVVGPSRGHRLLCRRLRRVPRRWSALMSRNPVANAILYQNSMWLCPLHGSADSPAFVP